MDPDAALKQAMSLNLDRQAEREEAARGLYRWIERGGWLPTVWRGMSRTEALAAAAEFVEPL